MQYCSSACMLLRYDHAFLSEIWGTNHLFAPHAFPVWPSPRCFPWNVMWCPDLDFHDLGYVSRTHYVRASDSRGHLCFRPRCCYRLQTCLQLGYSFLHWKKTGYSWPTQLYNRQLTCSSRGYLVFVDDLSFSSIWYFCYVLDDFWTIRTTFLFFYFTRPFRSLSNPAILTTSAL